MSKLNTAGENGQFRTPRHIIRMIVSLVDPKLRHRICDLAFGTGGFLVGAYQHILKENTSRDLLEFDEDGTPRNLVGDKIVDKKQREYLKEKTLFGFDFDTTMVRFGMMNLVLHGIPRPKMNYADTLSKAYTEQESYDVVLANPPFKGSIDKSDISDQLPKNTTKTELLFIHLMMRLLVTGGQCGVIFTKGGAPDRVWFYDMQSDGFSLDDKRQPVKENDIPDIIEKWSKRRDLTKPKKGDNWFWVAKKDIVENKYDLSISRYKPLEVEAVEYEDPRNICDKILKLEDEITADVKEIKTMLTRK